MKIKPYPPSTPAHFESKCKEWTDVINMEESGTWIWPVKNAPYRPIWQFLENKKLQKKLLGNDYQDHILLHVDLEQRKEYPTSELYTFLATLLTTYLPKEQFSSSSLLTMLDELTKKPYASISFFVTGIDASIRSNNWKILEDLNLLAERNWNTHILLFPETDVTAPEYFSLFYKKTTLAQNVFVTPLYTKDDVATYCKYLCFNWKTKLTTDQQQFIDDMCGGHYWLSKDVIRQVKRSPLLTYQDLEQSESLQIRAKEIVENLSAKEKAVLSAVLSHKTISVELHHEKKFLLKQGWIVPNNNGFIVTVPLIAQYILEGKQYVSSDNTLYLLSSLEKDVYNKFLQSLHTVITRQDIAKIIWQEKDQEKYSDWAIDQMIHRLREKLHKHNAPYEIKTKKGEGFILVEKSSQGSQK